MKRILVLIPILMLFILTSCEKTVTNNLTASNIISITTTENNNNTDNSFNTYESKINDYKNNYSSLMYNDGISVSEKDFPGYSAEGGKVKQYTADGKIIRYELILAGESGQRTVNLYILDEFIFVIDLTNEYDIPLITKQKSNLDYQLKKYVLVNNQIFAYDENNKTIFKFTENMQDLNSLINDIMNVQ